MYMENFFMMNLSRGGQTIWISVEDAEAAGIDDNDWIEAVNRNGVVSARAVVSHRMPRGTAFMHHAQDRTVRSEEHTSELQSRGQLVSRLLLETKQHPT